MNNKLHTLDNKSTLSHDTVVTLADHAEFVVLCSCVLSITFYVLHELIWPHYL